MRISKGRDRSGLFWATLSCRPIGPDSHGSTSSVTVPFFAHFNLLKRIDPNAETTNIGLAGDWRGLGQSPLRGRSSAQALGIRYKRTTRSPHQRAFWTFLACDNLARSMAAS